MRDATLVTTLGRDPEANFGIVNPPIQRASTILFETLAELKNAQKGQTKHGLSYGRYGTPTTLGLEEAVAGIEGAASAVVVGSGKGAIVATLLAILSHGDHVLVADNVYQPTRLFLAGLLARLGVAHDFFDPTLPPEAVAPLFRAETRLVYLESPGSLTFELTDVRAMAALAHDHDALVVFDNTWGTPLFFKPFDHGVDISIHAATKYLGGHSDLMMGIVTMAEAVKDKVRKGIHDLGMPASPEDCWLCLRGLRTLAVRLRHHHAAGLELARWLEARPEVKQVLHPGLPSHPQHALFQRDFLGASGLFGLILHPVSETALAAMLDGLELFGMGWSWGGYESLLIPTTPETSRSATSWQPGGVSLRMHVGLEDPDDLKADLAAGFARLAAA